QNAPTGPRPSSTDPLHGLPASRDAAPRRRPNVTGVTTAPANPPTRSLPAVPPPGRRGEWGGLPGGGRGRQGHPHPHPQFRAFQLLRGSRPHQKLPAMTTSAAPALWAKVIDQTRCIGCHACTTACKSENAVPLAVTRTYVKYVDVGEFPHARRAFQVTRCNQCDDAPCVAACPTGAMFRRPDGKIGRAHV